MTATPPVLEIIVPAYNESERLPATLVALREALAALGVACLVTVVDNASDDDTAALARFAPHGPVPVRVVSCETRGKGHAVRAGVAASTGTYVGFCDADLATELTSLPGVFNLLRSGAADIVVGSRSHPMSVVQARHTIARRLGAAVFRRLVRGVVPTVSDTQCGFKFFRGDLARAVFPEVVCGGFAFDVELLARAQRRGAAIVETEVVWVDVPGSTFSPLRHGARSLLEVGVIGWRMRSAPPVALSETVAAMNLRNLGMTPALGEANSA